MFFSSPPFIQVYSLQKVPRQDIGSVGWGHRGRLVAPQYPFPHLACKLHDLHRNPQGGGGESFQILDAVEFNAFCFLACPHPSLGRRAPLSSACECCSVSACSDSPNPFFSFPTAKSQTFAGNSSHLTYLYFIFIFKKPIKTKSVEYTSLPTGSKLASKAAPVLRPYQEGVFGGRERGRFCAPQIRRKQPSRPLTRLPAQRTRGLSLRSRPLTALAWRLPKNALCISISRPFLSLVSLAQGHLGSPAQSCRHSFPLHSFFLCSLLAQGGTQKAPPRRSSGHGGTQRARSRSPLPSQAQLPGLSITQMSVIQV